MSAVQPEQRFGKYRILDELGRGGFATVYRAVDTSLHREVALKILHPGLMTDPSFVVRFENDARATAQLDHPHIVAIYEYDQIESRLYIAMQLLPGGTLAARIQQRGQFPFTEAVRIVGEVAEALDRAHAIGFIHRDVKPTNILFNARDQAVLADFGLVKAVESSVIAHSTKGSTVGTPAYIAPEVWEGKDDGPWTDVYALGCVLFEMLTGQVLFKGSTPPAVMRAHFQPHQYPERWPADVPQAFEAVLEQALAGDPAIRYPSVMAFLQALNELEIREKAARDAQEKAALVAQWRAKAEAALAVDELSAGRMAVERWLELAPDDAAAHMALSSLEAQEKTAREAQEKADQVGQWRADAETALAAGELSAARKAIEHWQELAPDDPATQTALSDLETQLKQKRELASKAMGDPLEIAIPLSPTITTQESTQSDAPIRPVLDGTRHTNSQVYQPPIERRLVIIGSILSILLLGGMLFGILFTLSQPNTNLGPLSLTAVPTMPDPTTVNLSSATSQITPLDDRKTYNAVPPMTIDPSKTYLATITTPRGDIQIKLRPDLAPKTVNSFVFLAREGFYNGLTWHRVLQSFMAQGGDPEGTGMGGPGYTVPGEFTDKVLFDRPGIVAMARPGDVDGNGSQFFITTAPTPHLNQQYTIFGEVIQGQDIVDGIPLRDPEQNPTMPGEQIIKITITEQ